MGPAWGFRGYENIDSKRLAYNLWIRTVGVTILDGLIDFDAVLNDPSNPSHMLPQYLTDGIHPNNAGHQAMADAIEAEAAQHASICIRMGDEKNARMWHRVEAAISTVRAAVH